jgi:hypothetical protein
MTASDAAAGVNSVDAQGQPYISSAEYVLQDEILKVGGHCCAEVA